MTTRFADVVTIGECLVALVASQQGPLHEATMFERHIAGAEANTAVGLSRLGHSVAFVGRVGEDGFGRAVLHRLRGEGLDLSACRTMSHRRTGVLVRERRGTGSSEIWYLREGSAGAELNTEDVAAASNLIKEARWLHVSGVTAALSESARSAAFEAVRRARIHGTKVSVAVNYRAKLWPAEQARQVLRDLACGADVVFASADEARMLGKTDNVQSAAYAIVKDSGADVVVTLGGEGAIARIADGRELAHPGYRVAVVDTVGAGDAFVAGYLSATLRELIIADRLQVANACGAVATTALGDLPGLASWNEIEHMRDPDHDVRR